MAKLLSQNSLLIALYLVVASSWADGISLAGNTDTGLRADSHAPIGVMGDHMHSKGEWMISYRFMNMEMEGNLRGEDSISPEQIVSSVANPFSGPPNVRVVPTSMDVDMHMFGIMYAPSDAITLMGMVNYVEKEMDHLTYGGMMGVNRLGSFTAESSGLGDTKVEVLYSLVNDSSHLLHLNLGLSIPTGDIDQQATVLTPMNTRPSLTMPYAMQLGSGTYDLEPGITYNGYASHMAWGLQYRAKLPIGDNSEDYSWGDKHQLNAWSSYRFADWVSASLRLTYTDQDTIDGLDQRIMAPVQTANPRNYGGKRVDLSLGLNLVGQAGAIRGRRLALEYSVPIQQDVHGVQMEMKSMFTLGYQYAY